MLNVSHQNTNISHGGAENTRTDDVDETGVISLHGYTISIISVSKVTEFMQLVSVMKRRLLWTIYGRVIVWMNNMKTENH